MARALELGINFFDTADAYSLGVSEEVTGRLLDRCGGSAPTTSTSTRSTGGPADAERNGWTPFTSMQNHYNLLYREEEREMLPLCRDQGVGVIPWSPLARGVLAGTRGKDGAKPTARAHSDDFADHLYDDARSAGTADPWRSRARTHQASRAT